MSKVGLILILSVAVGLLQHSIAFAKASIADVYSMSIAELLQIKTITAAKSSQEFIDAPGIISI